MTSPHAIPQGKLQPIKAFTAQVRQGEKTVKGTAFVVSRDPILLVTCRHVVKAAATDCKIGTEVQIYFPQIREGDNKLFQALVYQLPASKDDDIVLLQLTTEYLPGGVEVAVLGAASDSVGYAETHKFRSFGFRSLEKYRGLPALGDIVDFTSIPSGKSLSAEPLMLKSEHIDGGMSGAPVLDLQRNLVVGVIAETWETRKSKDRDTSFAADCMVLNIAPLELPLYADYQLPLTVVDNPPTKIAQKNAAQITPHILFPLPPTFEPTQPPDLPEWAGRAEILVKLESDYTNPSAHLVGLIGFGGEGKSSIAYHWLKYHLLENSDLPSPDAVFWWSFYENRSFEQMVESLTKYLYGEQNLQRITGTGTRVNHIGAMALTKCLVLVLDGFEVMQETEGDKFGSIPNHDLQRLLELFMQPEHDSFCLLTSRAPLLDFLSDTGYIQRDVTRLSPSDGRDLLRNLDITGDDKTLDKIVNDWDGHALTVSLVGSYLRDKNIAPTDYNGDEIFPQVAALGDENPRYQRVRRVLQRYDEHLTAADKAFLKLFSVFRLPVKASAFDKVFRADTGSALNAPLTALTDEQFNKLLDGLETRRLLKAANDTYNAHPLVQRHYRTALESDHTLDDAKPIHKAVADHYQETSDEPGYNPTLDDLKPYIEIVHHLCHAGAYDKAWDIYRERIDQNNRNIITSLLGAFDTELNMIYNFFRNGDTAESPQISKPNRQSFILNEVGFCLVNLGRLHDAASFYERAKAMGADLGDHDNASRGYQNLARLYNELGELAQMAESAQKALDEARQVADDRERKEDERNVNSWLAWANHLRGAVAQAAAHFKAAETLEIEYDSRKQFLYGIRGIQHADHLRRTGDSHYARRVTEANLEICKRNSWTHQISQCHRVLGDLDADAGKHDTAQAHYEQAIALAGQVDKVDVKIQAFLARGRWYAKHMHNAESAFHDLDTALALALRGGYRIYEADIRVARAWAFKAQGENNQARSEAYIARGMSADMGYHWGKVDADEVLASLQP
jgi:tetratricopeptide (TPR) repeat protein